MASSGMTKLALIQLVLISFFISMLSDVPQQSGTYSEPSQTSKMELFAKIVNV